MLPKPKECIGCPLYNAGSGFSRPEGHCTNGVLLVGEALGYHEAEAGLPFRPYADAGHVLERAIVSLGMSREQFGIFNIVNCRPPSNELTGASYEDEAINHCKTHFKAVMSKFKPRVIVALGAVAARVLAGYSGKKMGMTLIQGFRLPAVEYPGVWVIPIWHPSYIQRGQWQLFPLVRRALAMAVSVASTGWSVPSLDYRVEASTFDLVDMRKRLTGQPHRVLSVDFETPMTDEESPADDLDWEDDWPEMDEADKMTVFNTKGGGIRTDKPIISVNLSDEIGTGLAVEMNAHTRPFVEAILSLPNWKTTHNGWRFDLRVANFNNLKFGGPLPDDTLWKFHHLYPDLPGRTGAKPSSEDAKDKDMGSLAPLQFCASMYGFPFPWKHLVDSEPGLYGCCDADSGLRVWHGVDDDMGKVKLLDDGGISILEGYYQMVFEIEPIFAGMRQRGIPVNREKIRDFTRRVLIQKAGEYEKLIAAVPQDILLPKQAAGLKKQPKDTTGYVLRKFSTMDEKCVCVKKSREVICPSCGGDNTPKPKKPKKEKIGNEKTIQG